MLGHDPEDPEGDSGNQRVLAVSASNLAPITKSIVYRIDTARVVGDTAEPIQTARMVEIGESGASGSDLLRGHDDERSGTDEAVDFLRDELANGPRPVKEIQAEARAAGISDKMLRSARERLGIRPQKGGFRDGWTWGLEDALGVRAPSQGGEEGHLHETPVPKRNSAPSNASETTEGALPDTGAPSTDPLPSAAEIEEKARELGLEFYDDEVAA
jgi:hypothetical protein